MLDSPNQTTIDAMVDQAFIFKSLDPEVRQVLKTEAIPRVFSSGDVLMREDEEGIEMMIIAAGTVSVSQLGAHGDVTLATLGPGSVVGEVSVITSAPRTSTVTACEDVAVISFMAETISAICDNTPRVRQLLLKLIEGRARHSISINPG